MSSQPYSLLHSEIQEIESFLSEFYGFKLRHSVTEHLVHLKDISQFAGVDPGSGLASTWFVEEDGHVWVGVYIAEDLIRRIKHASPSHLITEKNLGDFLIIAEEISHFHFVLNRMDLNIATSKTEIEMQGEIDKWLIASHFLNRQYGVGHEELLFHLIFYRSRIAASEKNLYEEASKRAYHVIKNLIAHPIRDSRENLREMYFFGRSMRAKAG